MLAKALQRWLDNHGLLAIAAAVLCIVLLLSILLVGVGYLIAAPR
jgi:predicted PurR-regulated permease PerM